MLKTRSLARFNHFLTSLSLLKEVCICVCIHISKSTRILRERKENNEMKKVMDTKDDPRDNRSHNIAYSIYDSSICMQLAVLIKFEYHHLVEES
jgi:hypothetical protein